MNLNLTDGAHNSLSNQTGLLLLCEVAAKPFNELLHSDYMAADKCKDNHKKCVDEYNDEYCGI